MWKSKRVSLFTGKPAGDDMRLGDLNLKPGTKIMMMGTREEEIVSLTMYLVFPETATYTKFISLLYPIMSVWDSSKTWSDHL